ncbi:MAG: hypothetical protein LUC34_00700 [Campylobacter sp.]|nr:hypothetical protein [Campylobacter sp.]
MGFFNFKKEKSNFAQRADKFWSEFAAVIDEIKSDLDAKEYETAMQKVDEKLKICLAESFFMVGTQGNKLDLVLTPEGLRHRLFWLNFIKQKMPKELESKMICTLGKQRADIAAPGIKMYDTCVNSQETDVYIGEVQNTIDIKLYNKELANLLCQD